MTELEHMPIPTEIRLHKAARTLELEFDDGKQFNLTCEYLRVFSPAADVKAARDKGDLVLGKEHVSITAIQPVGTYAVQLVFDDDHDTGVYSWQTLYDLGESYTENWHGYLDALKQRGYTRSDSVGAGDRDVQILYFATIANFLGKESEQRTLPESVHNVDDLLKWLSKQGFQYQRALSKFIIKVTVNKQFVPHETALKAGDEIAIVATEQREKESDE